MPTLSASDYTQYLKFKAAAATPIQPSIQTRTNATVLQSVLNANILASQAAYVLTPGITTIQNNARVQGQPPNNVNNPNALSTVGYAGTSGALSSSRVQQPGGLPTGFKNSQGTYTRIPQNAGWIQGGAGNVSSGPKRF
jgi:hypothetical protein